jgi:hypothetical protein
VFGRGERGARRVRYAVVEAVFVDFGDQEACIGDSALLGDGCLDILKGGTAAGGAGRGWQRRTEW